MQKFTPRHGLTESKAKGAFYGAQTYKRSRHGFINPWGAFKLPTGISPLTSTRCHPEISKRTLIFRFRDKSWYPTLGSISYLHSMGLLTPRTMTPLCINPQIKVTHEGKDLDRWREVNLH